MGSIKSGLISILAIGLLAGSAVGVVAQDADPMALVGGLPGGSFDRVSAAEAGVDGPAIVSGIMEYPRGREVGIYRFEDDWVAFDRESEGDLQMDDPRLSGKIRQTRTVHEMRDGGDFVFATSVEVTTDEGSWAGTGGGYVPAPGLHEWSIGLTGQGAFDGQSAMLFFRENPEKPRSNLVTGIIFMGDMPAFPEPPGE